MRTMCTGEWNDVQCWTEGHEMKASQHHNSGWRSWSALKPVYFIQSPNVLPPSMSYGDTAWWAVHGDLWRGLE